MGDKERMVWSPVWLHVLQTILWIPFKSHAQSSFDKSVLLSNQHSKMVGFCLGLAMPTLVWYTTLAQGTTMSGHPTPIGGTVTGQSSF